MDRYSKILEKDKREIVLLKSFPCFWGKCRFCDYVEDNSTSKEELIALNHKILKNITGEFQVLEVINSGSCFELPGETLEEIRKIIQDKNIKKLYLEAHWAYRNRLQEMRDFFKIPIIFKVGVETFDRGFRQGVLNKNADFTSPEEVCEYFDSPCLMIGIEGQTKEMIQKDIAILLQYFRYGTINIYTNNATPVKRDDKLVEWFIEEYGFLKDHPSIDFLVENTDFGVGD